MSGRTLTRPSMRMLGAGLVAAASVVSMAAEGAAQDIPAAAQVRGIPVPQGYYDRIARDPSAFTLPNGLFRSGAAGVRVASVVSGTH